jgi:hypothetical protein
VCLVGRVQGPYGPVGKIWMYDGTRPPPTAVSIEGADRYATNLATSRASFAAGSCDTIIGAVKAPVILVAGDVLRADIRTEMLRVTQGKTTKRIYILGSTGAVSAAMESSIKTALGAPSATRIYKRLQGTTRYGTAQAVAGEVKARLGGAFGKKAFVATGRDFPDALLAGPVAFDRRMPILLVNTAVDASLIATIRSIGASDVVIIGSTTAVNPTIETQLKSLLGAGHVTRPCAAADRYAQGVAVADWASATHGFGWDRIGVATGENFPDALGASVPQGLARTSLLLTPKLTLNAGVRTALTARKADISIVRFFGSVNAVSQPVRDAVMAAVR